MRNGGGNCTAGFGSGGSRGKLRNYKNTKDIAGGNYAGNVDEGCLTDCRAVFCGADADVADLHGRFNDGRTAGGLGDYVRRINNAAEVFNDDDVYGDECRGYRSCGSL